VFQSTVNKLVGVVLSVTKDVPLWTFSHLQYKQQQVNRPAVHSQSQASCSQTANHRPAVLRQPITGQLFSDSQSQASCSSVCQVEQAAVRDSGDDVPVKPPVLRPLDRQLAEHRDVSKSVQSHLSLSLFCL